MLTIGTDLRPDVRKEVLNAYGFRWTVDNYTRAVKWYDSLGMPQMELQTDEQWLAEHAFYTRKDGKLDRRYNHCVPAYMIDAA